MSQPRALLPGPGAGTGAGTRAGVHVRLSADQFYWAVLDSSNLPRSFSGHSIDQLGFLFESQLPLPIDELQAVYVRTAGEANRYIVCGMSKDALQSVSDALTLSPAALPQFIEERVAIAPGNGESFNLLTGEFMPPPVRKLRRRWVMQAGAIVLIVAGIIIAGVERRRQAFLATADSVRLTRASLIERLVGHAGSGSTQPPELIMTAELRSLKQTRNPDVVALARGISAAQSLSELLAIWPPDIHALGHSLIVTETSISIRVDVPTNAEAESFIAALQALRGWSLSQPSISAGKDGVTVQATFTRTNPGA